MNFKEQFGNFAKDFNARLDGFLKSLDGCKPKILSDSLKYSLEIGGKRIRPVLMYAAADLIGVPREKVEGFALALELVHTYSLIHDDLPEMDNDDFRRGKPSNHKVFGAGNAVLAGDGLLNTAYSLLFKECAKGAEYVSAASFVCDCAGIYGMIAGQSADLLHERDENCTEEELFFIYENKTGKLLTAPLAVPAILAGGRYLEEFKQLGHYLGCLFQITDDILDVEGDFSLLGKTTGKDDSEGKSTAISVFGLDKAKSMADSFLEKCLEILDGFEGDARFLKELVRYVRTRRD